MFKNKKYCENLKKENQKLLQDNNRLKQLADETSGLRDEYKKLIKELRGCRDKYEKALDNLDVYETEMRKEVKRIMRKAVS